MRSTRRVSSSVCRYACVRHSAETRRQRLSEGLSPPTPSPNVEGSAYIDSHIWRSRARALCWRLLYLPSLSSSSSFRLTTRPAFDFGRRPFPLLVPLSCKISHWQLSLTKSRCTLSDTAMALATTSSPPRPALQTTPATPTRNISKPPPSRGCRSL